MKDFAFEQLKPLFAAHGKRLYLVGGTVRDLLLGRAYVDHDMVTDATPDQIKVFLPDASYTFAKYGSVRLKLNGEEVDVTTLREEGEYRDHRHPSFIKFVTDPKIDSKRRDFTINAMYLDEDYNLLDFYGGQKDLADHLIRFIGDPYKRIEEDPLRIKRAERFAAVLGFSLEKETKKAIDDSQHLLSALRKEKIEEEDRKRRKG